MVTASGEDRAAGPTWSYGTAAARGAKAAYRAAEPAAARLGRLGPEPELVRDRRPGQRSDRLEPDTPCMARTTAGNQKLLRLRLFSGSGRIVCSGRAAPPQARSPMTMVQPNHRSDQPPPCPAARPNWAEQPASRNLTGANPKNMKDQALSGQESTFVNMLYYVSCTMSCYSL